MQDKSNHARLVVSTHSAPSWKGWPLDGDWEPRRWIWWGSKFWPGRRCHRGPPSHLVLRSFSESREIFSSVRLLHQDVALFDDVTQYWGWLRFGLLAGFGLPHMLCYCRDQGSIETAYVVAELHELHLEEAQWPVHSWHSWPSTLNARGPVNSCHTTFLTICFPWQPCVPPVFSLTLSLSPSEDSNTFLSLTVFLSCPVLSL